MRKGFGVGAGNFESRMRRRGERKNGPDIREGGEEGWRKGRGIGRKNQGEGKGQRRGGRKGGVRERIVKQDGVSAALMFPRKCRAVARTLRGVT